MTTLSFFLLSSTTLCAQFFEPEVYETRREAVLENLGEAIAIVPGYSGALGMGVYRQSAHLIYLAGVETPNAYLVLDGRSKRYFVAPQPVSHSLDTGRKNAFLRSERLT